MKKIFLILLLSLTLIVPVVWGHFPEVHVGDFLTNMNDPTWTSPLKQKIQKYPEIYLAGVMGVDSSVIYYLTQEGRNKIYGGTHSIKMVDECNRLAGSDEKKQIFCLGANNHLVTDITSHGYKEYEGYTSLCVRKYASTNIFLHSICERSVVNNYLANLGRFQYSPASDEIRLKTCDSYDLLIVGDEAISESDIQAGKCTNEYVKLLSDSAGVNLCQAVHIVGSNLKMMCVENQQLGSAYTDIYRNQGSVAVPTVWKWIAIISFIVIILILLANMIIGTWWKYLSLFFIIPLLLLSGVGVYFGFFAPQNFYHFYNFNVLDPLTNFIKVPDWQDRVQKSIQDTKDYLSDPSYNIPKSASGLDHYEGDKLVKGTLDKAETFGRIMWWTIITILLALFIFIEYKTFKRKRKVRSI